MNRWQVSIGAMAVSLSLAGCAAEPGGPENVYGDVSLRPSATEGLATPLAGSTIYLFEDRNFKGDVARLRT